MTVDAVKAKPQAAEELGPRRRKTPSWMSSDEFVLSAIPIKRPHQTTTTTTTTVVTTVDKSKVSGPKMVEYFQEKGLTYRASPKVNSSVKNEFSKIWKKNRRNFTYDFRSKEVKGYINCIELMNDQATDQYARNVEIKFVDDHMGDGLFALKEFKKNEVVGQYSGRISLLPSSDLREDGNVTGRDVMEYVFEFPDTPFCAYGVDAATDGNFTRFINHATGKEANLSSVEFFYDGMCRVIFIADKHISAGSQFFYDYGDNYCKLSTF